MWNTTGGTRRDRKEGVGGEENDIVKRSGEGAEQDGAGVSAHSRRQEHRHAPTSYTSFKLVLDVGRTLEYDEFFSEDDPAGKARRVRHGTGSGPIFGISWNGRSRSRSGEAGFDERGRKQDGKEQGGSARRLYAFFFYLQGGVSRIYAGQKRSLKDRPGGVRSSSNGLRSGGSARGWDQRTGGGGDGQRGRDGRRREAGVKDGGRSVEEGQSNVAIVCSESCGSDRAQKTAASSSRLFTSAPFTPPLDYTLGRGLFPLRWSLGAPKPRPVPGTITTTLSEPGAIGIISSFTVKRVSLHEQIPMHGRNTLTGMGLVEGNGRAVASHDGQGGLELTCSAGAPREGGID
ncbi:unnamed protein product [Cyclocybe aegerita]|uniref:Uncharacterized protein n=1 Tax=Cyclocybe aegerita TaxID=1973307 RepID=A0A8S0VZ11_CYCAE|nr:unnamed protein product [Cyclocybe aegerita]